MKTNVIVTLLAATIYVERYNIDKAIKIIYCPTDALNYINCRLLKTKLN